MSDKSVDLAKSSVKSADSLVIQRHPGHAEEEEVQRKPFAATITPLVQRHRWHAEEEEVQTKPLAKSVTALQSTTHGSVSQVMKPQRLQRSPLGSVEVGQDIEQRITRSREWATDAGQGS